MSDDQHSRNVNDNGAENDFGFYPEQQSDQNRKKEQKVETISDAFKGNKHKRIHKRQKGQRKQKTSKQQEKQRKEQEEAQKAAEEIIEQMEKRYDEDRKLYEKKRPANRKLTYMSTLSKQLRHLIIWEKFLQLGGLSQFQLWFSKLPEGIEPSLTLRKGLLQLLDSLKIKIEHISKVSSIQRIVQKHKKSQIKQLRELSESILLKWSKTLHEEDLQG